MEIKHGTDSKPVSKRKRKRLIVRSCIVLALVLMILPGFYNGLKIRHYKIDSDKVMKQVRIALVTDLHSCSYGENQEELVSAIDEQSPDIIALSGDIFDDEMEDGNTECFLSRIAGRYKCYYVTGNHEFWSGSEAFSEKMAILEKYDIPVLSGDCDTIQVGDTLISICGVDDPDSYVVPEYSAEMTEQLKAAESASADDEYTVLLSHRPELIELYNEYDFDLVLSGHAHGGQWRIPFLLNGLFAPDQGLFPRYAGGMYTGEDMTMIVSRGLARESTRVPRFYNPPELVIIDII